jgi:hypothetical protein
VEKKNKKEKRKNKNKNKNTKQKRGRPADPAFRPRVDSILTALVSPPKSAEHAYGWRVRVTADTRRSHKGHEDHEGADTGRKKFWIFFVPFPL